MQLAFCCLAQKGAASCWDDDCLMVPVCTDTTTDNVANAIDGRAMSVQKYQRRTVCDVTVVLEPAGEVQIEVKRIPHPLECRSSAQVFVIVDATRQSGTLGRARFAALEASLDARFGFERGARRGPSHSAAR